MSRIDLNLLEARLGLEVERLVPMVSQAPDRGCWVASRGNLALLVNGQVRANTLTPVTAPTTAAVEALVRSAGFFPQDFDYISLKVYLKRVLDSKLKILETLK